MRIVAIHSDVVEVVPKEKALKEADEKAEPFSAKEALAVFTAIEEGDRDLEELAKAFVKAVKEHLNAVKAERVVLYPYVHLTSRPASPRLAKKALDYLERALRQEGIEVLRAPFGWYKAFTLKAKGHPLSELSREIRPGEEEEETTLSLKQEEKLKSAFYVIAPDGQVVPYQEFNYEGWDRFKQMVEYETRKVRSYEKEPPHIRLMQELELVDYEEGSDSGHFRWYPKGRLIKKLMERHITDVCIDYGAFEVETPIMYDYAHPALEDYLNRFPARQYTVKSDKRKFFLRFAACFGQFLILKDAQISYKHLPLKIYELTRYSFRREQSGELAGLKRLRAFTMPDMHTLVRDFEMAKEEFSKQYQLAVSYLQQVGLPMEWIEIAMRAQKDFFEENRDWYISLSKMVGKPILIEVFEERYAYFITKFEFNFVDYLGKATTLSTVQIDVENAERYGITYVDEKGEKRRPLILHASISGAIERVLYALLEKAAIEMEKGRKAQLPLWLSPVQVRIIPVGREHVEKAVAFAKAFRYARVDVDDMEESLSRRIRRAQKEWIPYVAVVGREEVEGGYLTVTVRETGERIKVKPEDLDRVIKERTEGFPREKLTMPMLLSRRPVFRVRQ